jgi:hypothetical protein
MRKDFTAEARETQRKKMTATTSTCDVKGLAGSAQSTFPIPDSAFLRVLRVSAVGVEGDG